MSEKQTTASDTDLYAAWCRGYGEGLQTYPWEELLKLYQDKLVDAINDPRHFDGERTGLRMAAALFRGCLAELEVQNVES